jgi:hypothetical protein
MNYTIEDVEMNLNNMSWEEMSGGFNQIEMEFMLSDETRFNWLMQSDYDTIRTWLDIGKLQSPCETCNDFSACHGHICY